MKKPGEKPKFSGWVAIFVSAALLFGCTFLVKAEDNDEEIRSSISNVQKKIEKEESDKQKLISELEQIQSSMNRARLEISQTQAMIGKTAENILRKEKEIELLSQKMNLQKILLSGLIREMYYYKENPLEIILIKNSGMISFLGQKDHLMTLEEKIYEAIQEISDVKEKISSQKTNLEKDRQEYEKLLDLKEDQQKMLLSEKYETQGDIRKKEATIAELRAKLEKLRSNLSGYLGKKYNAKDIEDAARFASGVSGVRKDFIMGMLVVESDLGRFTGGCLAKDSRMSGTRLEIFKDICKELGYDWKKQKVSCPPKSYKGTGGAMGVAQFMSDTWMGYKSQIASVTGHNPPDPWNLTDGVVAMGLKLARGGATKKSGECNAAKLYLSGTTSSKYNWYCDKVKYWADNYERLLD